LGVGPGLPLEKGFRSPSDFKLFRVVARFARVPGCLGVDELGPLARPGAGRRKYTRDGHARGPAHAHVFTEVLAGSDPDPVRGSGPGSKLSPSRFTRGGQPRSARDRVRLQAR
jgi:hypothetical protein